MEVDLRGLLGPAAEGPDRHGRVATAAGILASLVPRRRRGVDVRVHHGQPAGREGEAYVITVLNASRRPVTVTQVWLATTLRMSVSTRPLPVTIGPGEQWETWIEARELPPGSGGIERLARIGLADGRVISSKPL